MWYTHVTISSFYCVTFALEFLMEFCDILSYVYFNMFSTSAESGSPSGWIDYFGQAIRTSVNYLPTQVSEVLTQSRDYAVAKLPVSDVKNVCAIATYVSLHIVIWFIIS